MREARSVSSCGVIFRRSACTPAAQNTVRASSRSDPIVTPRASIASTLAFVRTSTPISARSRRARSESSSENVVSTRGAASSRTTCAFDGIDPPEVAAHGGAADVGNGARQLDTGRSAADDHEREVGALRVRIELVFCELECDEHAAPHLGRLLERFQPGRKFLPFGMAEVAVPRAARQNQVVEGDFVPIAEDDLPREIDPFDAPETNLDVRRAPELHADRHGDVGGVEAGGCDLIEQRLEQVMVAVIDEDDAKALAVGERLRGVQTREAGADDDRDLWSHHRRLED